MEDTKYSQHDTTSFSYRKRPKPKRTTTTISIDTDEVDQEIFSSIRDAQNKLDASNAECRRLEHDIDDVVEQKKYLQGIVDDLEKENDRLRKGKMRYSPKRGEQGDDSFERPQQDTRVDPVMCHFSDMFTKNIESRLNRSPHRKSRPTNVSINFENDDFRRRERAWKQAEMRAPDKPFKTDTRVLNRTETRVPDLSKEVHVPVTRSNRQQVNIKELRAQMGRLIMDNYAPLQNKDKQDLKSDNRLADLEEVLRLQREEMSAAKSRLKTLEEEPFVLYCRRMKQ